jgi:CBS-domain-containing membrane protein
MRRPVFARDLMRHPVRQLTSWTPVRDAAAFLLRHGISGAPVIDEHGHWLGVFSQNDLARYVQNRLAPRHPQRTLESRDAIADLSALTLDKFGEASVRDFMTTGLFTVFPEATLDEVVHALTAFKVHRVFVIEERKGELLGVITTMDVMKHLDQQGKRRKKASKLART